MEKWLYVFVGGIISASLSVILPLHYDNFDLAPGISFGVLIILLIKHFVDKEQVGSDKLVYFVLLSILAYIAAFWSGFYVAAVSPEFGDCYVDLVPCENQMQVGFFAGGVVGAFILFGSLKLLFKQITKHQLGVLIFLSGLLGILGFYLKTPFEEIIFSMGLGKLLLGDFEFVSIFLVWQPVMAIVLYYLLLQNKRTSIQT